MHADKAQSEETVWLNVICACVCCMCSLFFVTVDRRWVAQQQYMSPNTSCKGAGASSQVLRCLLQPLRPALRCFSRKNEWQ